MYANKSRLRPVGSQDEIWYTRYAGTRPFRVLWPQLNSHNLEGNLAKYRFHSLNWLEFQQGKLRFSDEIVGEGLEVRVTRDGALQNTHSLL